LTLLSLTFFIMVFLTTDPKLPLYVDLGRYDSSRVLFLLVPLMGVLLFFRTYRQYKHGIEGENQVAKTLSSSLNDDYCLINDVSLPDGKKGNIDHVVLGPTGIFAIETKNQKGKIECNGDVWNGVIGRNPSKQARENATRIYDAIASLEIFRLRKPWIQGVVVFANKNADLNIHNSIKVEVKRIDELANYILTKESRRLSSQEIESIGKEILQKHKQSSNIPS